MKPVLRYDRRDRVFFSLTLSLDLRDLLGIRDQGGRRDILLPRSVSVRHTRATTHRPFLMRFCPPMHYRFTAASTSMSAIYRFAILETSARRVRLAIPSLYLVSEIC